MSVFFVGESKSPIVSSGEPPAPEWKVFRLTDAMEAAYDPNDILGSGGLTMDDDRIVCDLDPTATEQNGHRKGVALRFNPPGWRNDGKQGLTVRLDQFSRPDGGDSRLWVGAGLLWAPSDQSTWEGHVIALRDNSSTQGVGHLFHGTGSGNNTFAQTWATIDYIEGSRFWWRQDTTQSWLNSFMLHFGPANSTNVGVGGVNLGDRSSAELRPVVCFGYTTTTALAGEIGARIRYHVFETRP